MRRKKLPVLPKEKNKTDGQSSEKRFSYSTLAKILGIPRGTLTEKILTAEKKGKLEIEGRPGTHPRFTRRDLARILEFVGKDPSLAAQL